jgi:hypothetical protein
MLDNVELMHELNEMRKKKRNHEIELRKIVQELSKFGTKTNKLEADKKKAEVRGEGVLIW